MNLPGKPVKAVHGVAEWSDVLVIEWCSEDKHSHWMNNKKPWEKKWPLVGFKVFSFVFQKVWILEFRLYYQISQSNCVYHLPYLFYYALKFQFRKIDCSSNFRRSRDLSFSISDLFSITNLMIESKLQNPTYLKIQGQTLNQTARFHKGTNPVFCLPFLVVKNWKVLYFCWRSFYDILIYFTKLW